MKHRSNDETTAATAADAAACTNCELPSSRRRFLRDTFLSMAGALVAVGVNRATAFAMPLEFIEGARDSNHTISYAIPTGDGAQIDKKNEVILVRWQGSMYAFNLSCPHQNTALRWEDGDHQFQCPKHHSRFDPAGNYIADSGRATRSINRFAIARAGTGVSIDLDKLYQEDTDGAQWTAAVVTVSKL